VYYLAKDYFSGYKTELERCSRLYRDFKDGEPFVSAVYAAVAAYLKDNPPVPLELIDLEDSTEKIRAGQKLLINPELETKAVVDLLKAMGKAMAKSNRSLGDTVKILNKHYDLFLAEHPDKVSKEEVFDLQKRLIEETELENDLATFLFSLMLSSLYRQQLQATGEVLRTDLWEGGECLLCGERPHFGQLRSEDGAKQLECWLCGTSWVHTRIKCPFCDNEEQEELGYFTAEESEICRVSFCKSCCQYYKLIDARKVGADGELVLTIHNLATLTYDLLARQEGFTAGSGLEWVNEIEVNEAVDRQD
jgi:formate dehydrogenase maturation protein FdhE